LLARGRWFSPGTPASSTTKTGRHDIAEILLKVALNTINQIKFNIKSADIGKFFKGIPILIILSPTKFNFYYTFCGFFLPRTGEGRSFKGCSLDGFFFCLCVLEGVRYIFNSFSKIMSSELS
jgi:hypothetical protein